MAQPDIIVTAPLPPFLYDPLKADYRCHDYHQAEPQAGTARGGRAAHPRPGARAAER